MFENIKNAVFERKEDVSLYNADSINKFNTTYIPFFPNDEFIKKIYLKELKVKVKTKVCNMNPHNSKYPLFYGNMLLNLAYGCFGELLKKDFSKIDLSIGKTANEYKIETEPILIIKDKIIEGSNKFMLAISSKDFTSSGSFKNDELCKKVKLQFNLVVDADYIVLE